MAYDTAREILKEAYENKYGSQKYENSNLKGTYQDVAINAMHKYAVKSMLKVIKFINNYPYDWIEQVYAGNSHIIEHLTSKWKSYGKQMDDSRAVMVRLISELDDTNARKLMEFIDEQKFAQGGIINSAKKFFTGETSLKQIFGKK